MRNFIEDLISMDLALLKMLPIGSMAYSESNKEFYTVSANSEGEKHWTDNDTHKYFHLPPDAIWFEKIKD